MTPIEWGSDQDDGFFLLARVETVPPLEVMFNFLREGDTLAMDKVEVLVAGATPHGGITADLYRAVPIGRAYACASSVILKGVPPGRSNAGVRQAAMPSPDWIDPEVGERRQGRHPLTRRFLAEVAAVYVGLVQGLHPKPVDGVAQHFGVVVSTVSTSWLPKARQRGLLLGSQRGKAGGHLSPLAEALLRRGAGSSEKEA